MCLMILKEFSGSEGCSGPLNWRLQIYSDGFMIGSWVVFLFHVDQIHGSQQRKLVGGFKDFLCSPLFGEDSQFD